MRLPPRPRRRGPVLACAVAVAGMGVLAGCGEDRGDPIPTRSARAIVKRLDEVERRIDAGNACNDIREDSLPALRRELRRLPRRVDEGVRTTLQDGLGRLAELVEAECVEPPEPEPEPEPAPEPEPEPEIQVPETPQPDYSTPEIPDAGGDGGSDGGGGTDGGGNDGGGTDGGRNDGGGNDGGGNDGGGGDDGGGDSGYLPGDGPAGADSDAAAEATAARPDTRGTGTA